MIDFTAIILFCLLALGVSFRVGDRKRYEKKEGATGLEAVCKKNRHVLFLQSLRVLAFAFMTFFLFITMFIFHEEDAPGEAFSGLIGFMVVALFISIPIAIVYAGDGGMEVDCKIYDKPLTESFVQEPESRPDLVVYNRNAVFSCMGFTSGRSVFPGKESFLEKRAKSKHKQFVTR